MLSHLNGAGEAANAFTLTCASMQIKLQDGSSVHGFICESYVSMLPDSVKDITSYGGWVAYALARHKGGVA